MTRVAMLRAGYAGVGVAFAALAASIAVPSLLLPSLGLAFLAGVLLAFSDDDLPKWAGIALLAYFLLSALAFLAATPITIGKGGGYFVNKAPPDLAGSVMEWMGILSPLILGGAAITAAWEREWGPKALLVGAVAGFILVAVLTVVLVPSDTSAAAVEAAASQARMLSVLFALSAGAGAIGALWAAGRSEEIA